MKASDLRAYGETMTVAGRVPPAGEPAVFCRPVVTAPAVVRRDGTVLADAWLPDLVRLGELECHLGEGVIEAAVAAAVAGGRLSPRQRRRIMSYPLVIRLMIAMTLMPDASYCEALARLAGLLADIPFVLEWHVPTGKVVTGWRLAVPPSLMEDLFWHAAGPLISDDGPSAVMLAGMPVAAADGMLVNLADTPAKRAFFGTTGTADGSSPFPQLRIVAVTARAGRAMLGAILGQAGTGEQTLLARLVRRRPELFAGRVICFDRNFPGHDLVTAILDAGGHVIARVKEGISLGSGDGPGRGWLPDGSRMTWLNAPSGKKADRLPVRAAEHNVTMPGADGQEQVSQTCTIITTLLDHQAAPAGGIRDAYLTRWSASETTFGEDKTTVTGAGNRTSGPVLRSGCPRLVISEAWAWLAGTQLVRASEAAALASEHATGAVIGDRVKIGNYACVFGAVIADEVMICPGALLLEDPAPRATTPEGARKSPSDFTRRPVRVGPGATIGAGAVIAPGVTIGARAMVAIGAAVVRDVAAHALVAGNPARPCGWACACGATLDPDLRCGCGRVYTLTGQILASADAGEPA